MTTICMASDDISWLTNLECNPSSAILPEIKTFADKGRIIATCLHLFCFRADTQMWYNAAT